MSAEPQFVHSRRPRVAIVGMAGRFPGADGIDEFWGNLVAGVESLTDLTDDGLLAAGVAREQFEDPRYIRRRPLLEDIAGFDARLFGYNGRQAQVADPQQRVFLEVCHTALEHAGCDPSRFGGRIGVFAGGAPNTYLEEVVYATAAARRAVGDVGIEINNAADYIATRVAYALGLDGPAVSVMTACSTALVAVHMAARAIRAGECAMAVAGGVNIRVPDHRGEVWEENGMHARDGHIRAFDRAADGTNFGHGAGAVVLKDYDTAVADRDTVYALVAGSAINNDGARRSSFTAPSVQGQQEVISEALRDAGGCDPDTIGYVEAHGTGTKVGDPVEVTALSRAYREAGAQGSRRIPLGSVKTNIGHLGAAAGAPALIKTVLAMRHGQVPPSLHFDVANPEIPFEDSPFHVNRKLRPWPLLEGPKVAAVSAFGIGGTNAHVILEEAPPPAVVPAAPSQHDTEVHLLPVSAATAAAAARRCSDLADHLTRDPEVDVASVAYTLQRGRRQHDFRAAVVWTGDDSISRLGEATVVRAARTRPRVAFLFSGQGSQYVGMARELYRDEPHFRQIVDACATELVELVGIDLRDVVFGDADVPELTERLQQTRLTQPALFTIEYALAELWEHWGVSPDAMLGHSIGEVVAACRAGVFTLEAALRFVAARGRIVQGTPAGSMLAVPLAEADVRAALPAGLDVAAVNAPTSTVVSGPTDRVAEFEAALARIGVPATPLVTSHAFHSGALDPVLAELEAAAREARPAAPRTRVVSTVTGDWLTEADAVDPSYWARQARATVRFADAVATAADDCTVLLEVGPGRTLASLALQTLGESGAEVSVLSTLGPAGTRRRDARVAILEAAAELWKNGSPFRWDHLGSSESARRVPLPRYPYERTRHWVDVAAESEVPTPAPVDPGLDRGARLTHVPAWRQRRLGHHPRRDVGPILVLSPGAGPVAEVGALSGAIVVDPGTAFSRLGERRFRVAPASRDDYVELLRAIDSAGIDRPGVVVHGFTARPCVDDPLADEEVVRITELGFASVVALIQALAICWPAHPVELRVVTALACNVTGTDPVEPSKALVAGPTRSAPIEFSSITSQMIDLDGGSAPGLLVEELLAPIVAPVVAIRGSRRWVEEFESAVALRPRVEIPSVLKRRGVYLVTGGLGDVGFATAEALARTTRARLVLVSRTPLPDRCEWAGLLDGPGDRTREAIARVQRLEELGGEVMTAAADVADADAMAGVVAAVHERFGPINGVFHAAGVAGRGLLAMKSLDEARRVMRPKVDGLLVLDRLLADEVEMMVLYSSIFAISGGYGQSDYAAANAFLDAFAQSCSDRTARYSSINFCGWRGLGMVNTDRRVVATWEREASPATAGLLGDPVDDADGPTWTTRIGPDWHWVLAEHTMAGRQVFPGTSYVDMMVSAARRATGSPVVELRDVLFGEPLVIDEPRDLRVAGVVGGDGTVAFTVSSRPTADPGEWQRHASATASAVTAAPPPDVDLSVLRARIDGPRWTPDITDPENIVVFGPHWDVFRSVTQGEEEFVAELHLGTELATDVGAYAVHPSLLDCATALSIYQPDIVGPGESHLPIAYDRIVVWGPIGPTVTSHVVHRRSLQGIHTYDVLLIAPDGGVRVSIEGFAVRTVGVGTTHAALGDVHVPGASLDMIAGEERLIEPDEAIELLWRVLDDADEPQHVISVEPLDERATRLAGLARRVEEALGAMDSSVLADERAARVGAAPASRSTAPTTATETRLLSLWQDAFGSTDLGVEEDYFDLGGNSLVAVQLAVRVRDVFGVEVPGVVVMEYPSVREMAAYLDTLGGPGAAS